MASEGKKQQILDTINLDEIQDLDARKNAETLREGLLNAKSVIDVDWHWIAYCSAEANRLSIKATIMRSNNK